MTDIEYLDLGEALLLAVEQGCDSINDATEADIDCQRSGGMLTLVFANGSQIIANLQRPLHEVWLAARSGGYHYQWTGTQWQDSKGQGEFFAQISADSSRQAGLALRFAPPASA